MNLIIVSGILITILTSLPVILQMRNQPKGLYVCFFAEMWERFSYYGMRALLVLYLTQHFLFSDKQASGLYGSYTTLVYLLPLIGGVIADRFIGTRKAVIFGAILLVCGHLGMAFEGKPNQDQLSFQGKTYEFIAEGREDERVVKLEIDNKLYDYSFDEQKNLTIAGLPEAAPLPAVVKNGDYKIDTIKKTPWAENFLFGSLALIILGVGYLKPNISALVGQLYEKNDIRRDSGFQLYYFGINLGAFWAAILCGYLGMNVGWWAGFGLAGLGMVLGLIWFISGQKLLLDKGLAPDPSALKQKFGGIFTRETALYAGSIILIPALFILVQHESLVRSALLFGFLAILAYVAFMMVTKLNKVENYRIGVLIVLTLGSVVFWSLFEQAGSSLSLFSARNTDLTVFPEPFIFDLFGQAVVVASKVQLASLSVPAGAFHIDSTLTASQTQSFNSFFILCLAPLFSGLFVFLQKNKIDPDPVKKFAIALGFAGLGFLVLVWSRPFMSADFQVPVLFLLMTYLFHTIGELMLSPIGLSQMTRLSPKVLIATMMSVWFLGTAGGQSLAAFIAQYTETETVGGQVINEQAALNASLTTFETIGYIGIGLGLLMFLISFVVSKWDRPDEAA